MGKSRNDKKMPQIKRSKTASVKTPRIIEVLSEMTYEQITTELDARKKEYHIDVDKEIARRMSLLEEQSRILNRQTELSPVQMLVHFDI